MIHTEEMRGKTNRISSRAGAFAFEYINALNLQDMQG
jgi:hypothetical protein